MHTLKKLALSVFALAIMIIPGLALADSVTSSLVGVQGYDLVSYHQSGEPQKGNGNNVASHGGVTYVFANEANKKAFEANPEKYLPAYGGYCAYGVAVGKKFVGDPLVYKVVGGKLYLNLDQKVAGIWEQDIPGNITKAETQWPNIKNTPADKL